MSKKRKGPALFDDDFEITYEDDSLDILDFDEIEYEDDSFYTDEEFDDRTVVMPSDLDSKNKNRKKAKKKKSASSNTEKIPVLQRTSKKDTPKAYGNRHIYDTSFYVIRTCSIILGLSIIIILSLNFFRGAAPYGDIMTLIQTRNLSLALYLGVSGFITLFYSLMILFSFRRERVEKKGRSYKLDMGKGTFTYVSLYIISYLSFIFSAILPDDFEFFGYTFLKGFAGALDVFGSMHNILLGMCVAGVIACKARKHMN